MTNFELIEKIASLKELSQEDKSFLFKLVANDIKRGNTNTKENIVPNEENKSQEEIKSTNNFKPLSLEDINSVINQEPEKEAPKQEKDNVQVSDIPNENINIDSAPLTIDEINNVLELSQGNVEAKPKRGM